MTNEQSQPDDSRLSTDFGRRKFIAIGGSASAALLAGCTSDSTSSDPDDGSDSDSDDDSSTTSAAFRLLISDMPADIGDFDRLDVTFDSARIFDGGDEAEEEDGEEETAETETDDEETEAPTDTESTAESTEEETPEETDTDGEDEEDQADGEEADEEDEEERGFYILDLDDPTVDLTQVVGDKAMPVFDGELEEGSYQKMELNVSDVEGIVDGEEAEVKVPSEKLQLTKPFEVRAGESLDFVFDINVVKRGQQNSYNLTPVISKSGVKGEDVEVEEIGEDGDDEMEDEEDEMEDQETEDGGMNEGEGDEETETDGTPTETETDGTPTETETATDEGGE